MASHTPANGEREPLLPSSERSEPNGEPIGEPDTRVKKAKSWVVNNAVMIFMSLLILAVIIALCVFFGINQNKNPEKPEPTPEPKPAPEPKPTPSVCTTPACVHASSGILYNLSPDYKNIDPCSNFEELTCGGWSEQHDLRPDQGDAFTGTIMSENSQMLLRHILEAPYPEDSKHSSFSPAVLMQSLSSLDKQNFDKLKSAYDACMDEGKVKKVGVKPLLEILHQIQDFFPVKNTKSSRATKNTDLADTLIYLGKLGVNPLTAVSVGADDKDPDTVVVQASPPYRIGLPAKDYYKDPAVVAKYETALTKVMSNLYPITPNVTTQYQFGKQSTAWPELAHQVVDFESKLAAASPDAEDSNDVTYYYNPMSLKDASALVPAVHLAKVIKAFAPADSKPDRVIVASPAYMKNLSDILSATSKEVIQTHFLWKTVQVYAPYLEADEIKPYKQFINDLQGKDPDSTPDRWRTCVNHVDDGLGWILSRFFVEKAFSEKAKIFGDQIVSDIKDTFIEKIKKTTWMDKDVAKLAIEKVHKIIQKIGYPTKSPDIMNPSSLNAYYQSINITPSTFFENAIHMQKFGVASMWSEYGKPVDRDSWGMTVPTVNAYYNPPGNEIVFPAGIMQFPVFDVNVPQYLSYGAFGSVSGHELSHAFDSTGRHYDQNGNYSNWWNDATVEGFEKRAQCFVDQYAEYTIPGPDDKPLHVNGKLTLGENIADAGGVAAAFSAWQKRRNETPNEDLPGLNFFTQEQLFFVSYANWWCGKSRKETAITRIYTDPHAPKWARILGTMANSREFKESFGCAKKEPVCELW